LLNFNKLVKTGMQIARDLYERVKESMTFCLRFADNLLEPNARIAAFIQILLVDLAPIVFLYGVERTSSLPARLLRLSRPRRCRYRTIR